MAKPTPGTKGDDVFLADVSGSDINGLGGFDVVVFSGPFDLGDIEVKETGNLKTTVVTADGTFSLKNVEMLRFESDTADFKDDVFYDVDLGTTLRMDARLDEAAINDVTGDPYHGTGNDPENYVIVRNEAEGIEIALQVKQRGGPSFDPVSVEADGTVHYEVPSGTDPSNSARAFWNFDFSIATGLNDGSAGLDDLTFKLLVDTDITSGTDYRDFTLEPEPAGPPFDNLLDSDFMWVDENGIPVIVDDRGVAGQVTQNSENYSFGFIRNFIDGDPGTPGLQAYNFGPGTFDLQLQAYDGAQLVAVNHIVVDVVL